MALAALVCTVAISVLALSPVHGHTQKNCEVCMSGHLPLLAAMPPTALPALEIRFLHTPVERVERRFDVFDAPSDSRAPPTNPLY